MNSAQQLKDIGEFKPFSVDKLIDNSTTDFDLYVRVADHMILYGSLGYRWMKEELERLLRSGHDTMFVAVHDSAKVQTYERLSQLPKLQKDLDPISRVHSLEDVGSAFVKCLYDGEVTAACVTEGKKISDALTQCVLEDPKCIKAISGLADHDYYTYYHSVRVSMYSVAIAMTMGLKDEAKLREIALGALFHDVGKKEVGLDILNKSGALTEDEWEKMKAHPLAGHQIMEKTKVPLVPLEIILHHHEKLDGSGYPHGLDRNSLLPEVQIATLADVFDALTSARSYQMKRSRYEALDFIKHKMLGSKLPTDAYAALIACLV